GVMAKALFEEAPFLRDVCQDVPPQVDALVARLLSKDPARRPPDAMALCRELCALLAKPDAAPAPVSGVLSQRSLTVNEMRLISVVLASAPREPPGTGPRQSNLLSESVEREAQGAIEKSALLTLLSPGPAPSPIDELARFAERCGARVEQLPDGAVV